MSLRKNLFNVLHWLVKEKETYYYFIIILILNIYLYFNNILQEYWIHILIHEYFGFIIVEKYFKDEGI